MTSNSTSTLNVNLQRQVRTDELANLFHGIQPKNFGHDAYRYLDLDEVVKDVDAVHLCVPEDWLHLRWDHVHDGYQYLGLQHPLTLILSQQPPPEPLNAGKLRVLFTSGILTQDNFDDEIIHEFTEHSNRLFVNHSEFVVDVTVEREVTGRKLIQQIQTSRDAGEPFHLWHHVGDVSVNPEGIALHLADGVLKPTALQAIVKQLESKGAPGCRVFVLHTSSHETTLLPSLSKLPFPCVIGLKMGSMSQILLRGLYMRLLSKDIGTAVFLAHLDCYIEDPKSSSWSTLELLCRTQPLRLVTESWKRSPSVLSSSDEKPRFMFLRANPIDSRHMLPIDGEIKHIKNALAYRRGEFTMRDEGALEIHEFSKYLGEMRPHLLHFSGHGSDRGSLLWESGSGTKIFVQPDRIAPLLMDFTPPLQCVVLNACHSNSLADLLRGRGVVVIGMANTVTDPTAAHFARALYQALAHGNTLARAFDLARDEIHLIGASNEANIPQISDYDAAASIQFFKPETYGEI